MNRVFISSWFLVLAIATLILFISNLWLILGKVQIVNVKTEHYSIGYFIASITILIIGLNSWFIKYFQWGKSNENLLKLNKLALLLYVTAGIIFWLFYWLPGTYS